MDLHRITHPLRLAMGSHSPGSGKGCAMNVISYINGDAQVTDFPTCSARPLSLLVQSTNDLLAGADGYLSPEHSVVALDLAWQTVGTADVPDTVVHAWVAELLTDPVWGVLRYTKITSHKAILDVAELHRAAASDDMAPMADWDAAGRTARAVATNLSGAGTRAVQAASESSTFVDNDLLMALDKVVVHAQNAYALASGDASAAIRVAELTGHAIRSWRRLAELDAQKARDVSPALLGQEVQLAGRTQAVESPAGTPEWVVSAASRPVAGHGRDGVGEADNRAPHGAAAYRAAHRRTMWRLTAESGDLVRSTWHR